jgi:hypothetical protein
VRADRLMINPDCGLRHLAPEVARQKLRAMVAGVALVRAELGAELGAEVGVELGAELQPAGLQTTGAKSREGETK